MIHALTIAALLASGPAFAEVDYDHMSTCLQESRVIAYTGDLRDQGLPANEVADAVRSTFTDIQEEPMLDMIDAVFGAPEIQPGVMESVYLQQCIDQGQNSELLSYN